MRAPPLLQKLVWCYVRPRSYYRGGKGKGIPSTQAPPCRPSWPLSTRWFSPRCLSIRHVNPSVKASRQSVGIAYGFCGACDIIPGYQEYRITLPSIAYNFIVTQRHSYCWGLQKFMVKPLFTLVIAFSLACIGRAHAIGMTIDVISAYSVVKFNNENPYDADTVTIRPQDGLPYEFMTFAQANDSTALATWGFSNKSNKATVLQQRIAGK